MLKKILIVLAVLIVGFVALVATRPDVTTVERSRASDSIAQVKASVWLMNSVIVVHGTAVARPPSPLRTAPVTLFSAAFHAAFPARRRGASTAVERSGDQDGPVPPPDALTAESGYDPER